MTQASLERRKTERRQAQGKIFVLFDQYHSSVGQLLNICRDGLCCLIEDGRNLEGTRAISLIAYGENDSFTAIHALPLDNLAWQKKNGRGKAGKKIRLHFGHLTPHQQSQLSRFLSQHTGYTEHAPAWLT